MGTPEFDKSRDERKKVEMRFAHLKTIIALSAAIERAVGARDEFHLAASCKTSNTGEPLLAAAPNTMTA